MAELERELSRFDMTMIAIGSTIGSGIFLALGVPVFLLWNRKPGSPKQAHRSQ